MDVLDYESPCPTFALAFSPLDGSGSGTTSSPDHFSDLKMAVGSFVESANDNHVTIVGLDHGAFSGWDDTGLAPAPGYGFVPLAKAPHLYPPTALAFSPPALSQNLQASGGSGPGALSRTREMLATSSDCIRLWDFAFGEWGDAQGGRGPGGGGGYVGDPRRTNKASYRLMVRAHLANHKEGYSAPLTAFSWSHRDPSLIVTSSIDTTCTVWDISSGTAITQLIAHDREVYDVCWSSASRDVFASVGADGSVRTFDLRSLDHSTILFESQPPAAASSSSRRNGTSSASPPAPPGPLLRLKFNSADPNYIAVSSASGIDVNVLDVRVPGVPVVELRAHQANVNGLAWSGEGMILATCGDDSQVLVWDLSHVPSQSAAAATQSNTRAATPHTRILRDPVLAYTAPQEANSLSWSESHRDRIAVGLGRRVRMLRV